MSSLRSIWGVAFVASTLVAALSLAATATFMFDAGNTRFVAEKADEFGVTHNCLTAYAVAAHLADERTENLYDPSLYRDTETPTPIHDSVDGTFTVDNYHYPPQFLILPHLLLLIAEDFFTLRAVWFSMTVLCLVGALVGVAHWYGALRSTSALIMFPLLLCAPTVYIALQVGNAHVLIIALSVLAMLAFETRRPAVGGALLGFAAAAKVWPAVLVAYLLLQRRWKDASWCVIAVLIYTVLAMALFGLQPIVSFLTFELPRIASGEAFGFMASIPRPIITNMSVFGIPHKLHALGLLSTKPALISPVLSWSLTTLVVMIVALVGVRLRAGAARDDHDRLARAQIWLALLTLVQLRSPFLPWPYGVLSTLWLLLLLAGSTRGWLRAAAFAAWLFMAVNAPTIFSSSSEAFRLGYTLVGSLIMFGAIIAGLLPAWKVKRAATSSS